MTQEQKPLEIAGEEYDTWAKFLHLGDKVFTEVGDIHSEIVDDTNRVCGANKGISDKAIHLKLFSTKTPSLTLVDLPGLTKIAVGDQPRDIDRQIDQMVRSYAQKENSIILAVSPGNIDIANSDSIKLARELDPHGTRTIAVITKCDLMDRNEETLALLDGTSVDVKLGLVGVINKSQDQLRNNIPFEKIQELEEYYFDQCYPTLADRMGTEYLTNRLCDILISHLKKCLPALSEKISQQQEKHKQILTDVGEEMADPYQAMILLLTNFCDSFAKSIGGQFTYEMDKPDSKKLATVSSSKQQSSGSTPGVSTSSVTTSVGAELFDVFDKECVKKLSDIPPDKNLEGLKELMHGTKGVQPSLFLPDSVFNTLMVRQLNLFDSPCMNAIEKSHKCLSEAIGFVAAKSLARYPKLETEVVRLTREYLAEQLGDARKFLLEHIDVEKSFINTNHPDFNERYQLAGALFSYSEKDVPKKKGQGSQGFNFGDPKPMGFTYITPTGTQTDVLKNLMTKYHHGDDASSKDRANKEAELMEKLLIQYFCIVRSRFASGCFNVDIFRPFPSISVHS